MSISSSRSAHSTSLADYLRAFASRREAWIVLGRNLIPVVGVYLFDWSVALTTFNYWFDGVTALAAILAAVIARGVLESRKASGAGMVRLVAGGVLIWVIILGLCGMPYWFLLDSVSGVLRLSQISAEVEQSPALWFTFAVLALSQFWKAFTGGYLRMPPDKLKSQVQADFFALIARAVAMQVIARVGLGLMLVPAMALVLTHIEVWPALQSTMLASYQARKRT
jgi:hypothetical protein